MKRIIATIGIIGLIGFGVYSQFFSSVPLAGATTYQVWQGGTGFSTAANGVLVMGSGTNVLSKLATGSAGQVLTMTAGLPAWAAAAAGGGGSLGMREGFTAAFTNKTSISFEGGAFNLSTAATDARLSLDYTNGPASRSIAQTWLGLNTFSASPLSIHAVAASVSANLEVSGYASASTLYGDVQNTTLYHVPGATYSSMQNNIDIAQSAGWVAGGVMASVSATTISVTAGQGLIRTTDSDLGLLGDFDWPASNSVTVPTNQITYIGVQYNAGSPKVEARTDDQWNYHTEFPLGRVVNQAGTLFVVADHQTVADAPSKMVRFNYEAMPFARDVRGGGLMLAESADGQRHFSSTAGAFWDRLNRYVMPAINTASGWTADVYFGTTASAAPTSTWPNDKYNNGGVLTTMVNTRFANDWIYECSLRRLVLVYGTNQYVTLAGASAEQVPSTVPQRVSANCILIGRIIFQKNATTASEVDSAFTTSLSPAAATNHANLSNLTWTSSGHTGTANTLAGFNSGGTASESAETKYAYLNGLRAFTGQISGTGASFSTNFEVSGYASASKYYSGGLATCSATGNVLRWTGGSFSCATLTTSDINYSAVFQPLDATLTAVAALDATTGFLGMTGADTFVKRTMTGTTNQIAITNGDSQTGNPVWSIPSLFILPGAASVSTNFEVIGYASISKLFGTALTDCSNATTSKLLWTASTGKFTCGVDQNSGTGGGSFNGIGVREGTAAFAHITSLSFVANGFNLTNTASLSTINLDYTNGPASRTMDQTISGIWSFTNAITIPNSATGPTLTTGQIGINTGSSSLNFSDGATKVLKSKVCFGVNEPLPAAKDQFTIWNAYDPFTISEVYMRASGSNAVGWNLRTGSGGATNIFTNSHSASGSATTKLTNMATTAISDGFVVDLQITSASQNIDSLFLRICGTYQ